MRMLRRKDHRIEYNVLISIYNFTTTKKRHIEIFKINILRIVRHSIVLSDISVPSALKGRIKLNTFCLKSIAPRLYIRLHIHF